jgi:hypothetical protein
MKTARLCSVIFVALALVLSVGPARADVYTLTNNNSTLSIDSPPPADTNPLGAYVWTVDGTGVLYQQWFWYRVGSSDPEAPINNLPLVNASNSVNGFGYPQLTLTYGSLTTFEIAIEYTLVGGTAGSHISDVNEQILISNKGSESRDFHFFQYSDFDLSPDRVDNVVIDPDLQLVNQTPADGGSMLSEAVLGPKPNHAEANYYPATLNKLNDGVPTTLNGNLTAGPGDVTWAFEWDPTIAAGGSYIISKDKLINPSAVPEPATILGLGTILLLVGRKLSRRQA